MNRENTVRLCSDFPYLYRGRKKSLKESLMSFGFECGDGWFEIIYRLSQSIEAIARKNGLDPTSDDWPEAVQVKEKFGTLSFYLKGSAAPYLKQIIEAHEQSSKTCELCGKPGKLTGQSWIRVLCTNCQLAESKKFPD